MKVWVSLIRMSTKSRVDFWIPASTGGDPECPHFWAAIEEHIESEYPGWEIEDVDVND